MNGAQQSCPPECDVRVTHLEERMGKADTIHESLFSKISTANECITKRVKTATLFVIAGLLLGVLGGAFMLLYNQGSKIGDKVGVTHQRITGLGEKVHSVEVQVVAVREQMKAQAQISEMMKEDIRELKEGP